MTLGTGVFFSSYVPRAGNALFPDKPSFMLASLDEKTGPIRRNGKTAFPLRFPVPSPADDNSPFASLSRKSRPRRHNRPPYGT